MKASRFSEEQIIGILREQENGVRTADAHHRPAEINRALVAAICRGHTWFDEIVTERISTTEIARREDVNPTYVSRMVRMALLSPGIVKAIMAGRQPPSLNIDVLMKDIELPWSWADQEAVLGF